MSNWYWLCILAYGFALTAAGGCGSDADPVTQLIVEVNADAQVAARLKRIRALVYAPDAEADAEPLHQASFALTQGAATDGFTQFPFSFGVARKDTDEQLIVVLGYTSLAANSTPIIEAKRRVRYVAGHSEKVELQLAEVCLNRAEQCMKLDRSCSANDSAGVSAGACQLLRPELVDAGGGARDASAPLSDAGAKAEMTGMSTPSRDAGRPQNTSVSKKTQPVTEDQDASTGAEPALPNSSGACAAASCDAAYGCVESSTHGYSCEGQLAEWPMPDTAPNAKFKPSYDTTSDPDVVIDKVTGLLWQRNLPATYADCTGKLDKDADSCSFEEARQYCAKLDLQHAKWRLPSKIELESLVDMSSAGSRAYIDNDAFPQTPEQGFWTGSPSVYAAKGYAWTVSFSQGYSADQTVQTGLKVRCTRSILTRPGTPQDRYRTSADGMTVTDTRSMLEWQHGTSGDVSYEQAESYCTALGSGFRVPTLKELLTLVDPTRSDPACDPVFEKTPTSVLLFASTPDPLVPAHTSVMIASGSSVNDLILQLPTGSKLSLTSRVRCVR